MICNYSNKKPNVLFHSNHNIAQIKCLPAVLVALIKPEHA